MQPQYITLPRQSYNLTGQRFGRLVALGPVENTPAHQIKWLCRCDCGNTVTVVTRGLTTGNHTRSCGCLQREVARAQATHHMTKTPLYKRWNGIIARCTNPDRPSYPRYGGRGITICAEWRNSFESFRDYVTQLPNCGKKGYSLDRIDNDGNYEPGNVRWATQKEQSRNMSVNNLITYNGKTQCITDWADELQINHQTLRNRIGYGWPIERVMTEPVQVHKKASG